MKLKFSNDTWDVTDSQSREPEDINFSKPYEDTELKRVSPPRYDKRKDWYQSLNEKGHDSDVNNRYDSTSLTSGANIKVGWRTTLSEIDVAPGFIPTNKGMQTPEDIFSELEYSSYAANRDYDRFIGPEYSKKIPNPDYDFEESRIMWRNAWKRMTNWSDKKLDIFERRYYNETGGK